MRHLVATSLSLTLTIVVSSGCGLLLDPDPLRSERMRNGGGPVLPLPGCDEPPDGATVALFRMEDVLTGVLTDATGTHDGTFEGEVPEDVEGPGGCGRAMVSRAASHGVIPPHEEFRLTRGAIDLWVKVADRSRRCESFLSRDASQQDLPGHFTMYAADNGHLGVRLQSSPRDAGALVIFSDAPATPETWVHVGVNFGPEGIALFIDGVRQSGDGPNGECTSTDDICTADCTTSIEGNDNPWSVGAGSTGTIEGTAMGVNAHFFGALDEVRISSTHRDFEGAGL